MLARRKAVNFLKDDGREDKKRMRKRKKGAGMRELTWKIEEPWKGFRARK